MKGQKTKKPTISGWQTTLSGGRTVWLGKRDDGALVAILRTEGQESLAFACSVEAMHALTDMFLNHYSAGKTRVADSVWQMVLRLAPGEGEWAPEVRGAS